MRDPCSPTNRDLRLENALVVLALMGVILPFLLFSSPEYREFGMLVHGVVATGIGLFLPPVRRWFLNPWVRAGWACVFVVQAATFAGGLSQGQSGIESFLMAARSLLAIAGIAVSCCVVAGERWREQAIRLGMGVAAVLVVASLLGFFVFPEWHVALARESPHADARRLALVWPTRILTQGMGQEFWDHTNTAAYYFAIAWVVIAGRLHRPGRFNAAGWILAGMLVLAVFLTGSRAGWVMIAAALPFLLVLRGWKYVLRTVLLLAVSSGVGFLGLKYKLAEITPPPSVARAPDKWSKPGAIHVGGLVDRGSAGRLDGYQLLWKETEGHRACGLGHPSSRKPIGPLLHEHSTYLATLRSGGLIALTAHLILLGISLRAAIAWAFRGKRGPLVFGVTVFSGLLFDRSTVFLLTGFDEFPTHWLAVWLPLALGAGRRVADGDFPPAEPEDQNPK